MHVIYLLAFFIEVIILFFLSRVLSKTLSRFLSANLMLLIFLPGVIIHELSHLLIAAILFVPVGDMEFAPRKDGNKVKLGSVEIAKTDPIRRSIIGFAPVFVGLMIIMGIVYFGSVNVLFLQNKNPYIFITVILASAYLLFAIGNTMFSSSRDMEGTVEILITLLIFLGAAYILGFRPSLSVFSKILTREIIGAIRESALFLLAPIFIDLFILGTIKLFIDRQENRI